QFSSISKFGLLELSRQRLRPALSEGNHITCPRCNGTGHIRDTESSALQILRIIQEEALKDNTAAVHVQVPVEVVSFLLNEKRTEITKIELKQRVTVLLVPNKHLETPNYKLERLRHDDPRLENLQASYTMIQEPDDEVGITRREKPKAKQEPVIKGVLPDQPAPVAPPAPPKPAPVAATPPPAPVRTPVAAAPEAGSGFFAWVKKLFAGAPAAPTATPAAAKAALPAPAAEGTDKREGRDGRRGERGGRGDRGGERGGRGGRGGEGRAAAPRGERTERGERGERGDRADRGSRRNEGAEGAVAALPTVPQTGRDTGREERPRRGGAERGERGLPKAPESGDTGALQAFSDTIPAPEGAEPIAADGERDGRRRRRRGGRGGRDRDETRAENGTAEAMNGEANTDAAPVADERPLAPASARVGDEPLAADGNDAAPVGEGGGEDVRRRGRSRDRFRRERRPDDEPRSDAEGNAASLSTVATSEADAEPAAIGADAPWQPAAATPVVTAPYAPVPAPVSSPEVSVAVAAEPFVLPVDELQSLAQGSGLQWVNSDAAKISAVQAAMAAEPKAIHVPRERKPVLLADDGPLVLVETRKDLSQLKLPFEPGAAGPQAH
ncbi:MAG TPA: ribonuclease E/G, partial [Rubrivivax sp.]